MAAVKQTIRDGGTLVAMPLSDRPAPPAVRPADTATVAIPSPARELQQRLNRQASAELRLPSHRHAPGTRRELTALVVGATLLWGATLGGIFGLLYIAG